MVGRPAPQIAMVGIVCAWIAPWVSGGRFQPPEGNFLQQNQIDVLRNEMLNRNYAEAAARLESLLRHHGDERIETDEGLESVWAWVEQWLTDLPASHRGALAAAHEGRFGEANRRLVETALRDPATGAADLWALARRMPLSTAGREALAAAGDRAAAGGDLPAALTCWQSARAAGREPGAVHARLMKAAGEAPAGLAVYRGPVPMDARWYGNPEAFTSNRHVPYGSQRLVYVAGARQVMCFKEGGPVAWNWSAPRPASELSGDVDRSADVGRGEVFQPVALEDDSGAAQVLVVRQYRLASREFCLRAFRAADGKPLWSTDDRFTASSGKSLVAFVSTPLVRGRMVYAVVVDAQRAKGESRSRALVMLALDVLSGQVIWQSVLGTVEDRPVMRRFLENRWGKALPESELEHFWQQGPPAVDGQGNLLIAGNTGYVQCLDRFTGKLRWARPYPRPGTLISRHVWSGFRKNRLRGREVEWPLSEAEVLRFTDAPVLVGKVLVVAPQDSSWVYAFDPQRGRVLWESQGIGAMTLIGAAGDAAIFAGSAVRAVDSANGRIRWTYSPAAGLNLTGPPVVAGSMIHVPTSGGVVTLSATDGLVLGRAVAATPRPPDFRLIVNGELSKPLLTAADVIGSFGFPPVRGR